jgi:hypothetical protein
MEMSSQVHALVALWLAKLDKEVGQKLERKSGQESWTGKLDRKVGQVSWIGKLDRKVGVYIFTILYLPDDGYNRWSKHVDAQKLNFVQ